MIDELINKQDTFELVRDKVAQILADESANQMVLAAGAGFPPAEWKLDVYTERSNPWEKWLNDTSQTNNAPIVNVWFSSDNFDMAQGNVVESQAATGTINVDCIGFGVSRPDGSGGQIIGDELAAKEAARAVRLARNILMASQYTYLDMRGLVARRWVESRAFQQPQLGEQSVQKIVGARLALGVKYLELAPQYQGQLLEQVGIDLLRASDGRVLAQLEYDYTT